MDVMDGRRDGRAVPAWELVVGLNRCQGYAQCAFPAPDVFMLAAGNRDPKRFRGPDRFIPDREENQHLGFGGGMHNCYGAALPVPRRSRRRCSNSYRG